jgi:hypothetical protein
LRWAITFRHDSTLYGRGIRRITFRHDSTLYGRGIRQ